MGELAALEQIREDSETLDAAIDRGRPVRAPRRRRRRGPATARRAARSRNLFGSQAAFQAETMASALERRRLDREARRPRTRPTSRPRRRGSTPARRRVGARAAARRRSRRCDYGFLWALWLEHGALRPVERARPRAEHGRARPAAAPARGGHRRGARSTSALRLRADTTLDDLACAIASMIEGVWLNQCLTTQHPTDPDEPIATVLRRSGRLLWRGAVDGDGA